MNEEEFLKKFKEVYKGKVLSYEEVKKQKELEKRNKNEIPVNKTLR